LDISSRQIAPGNRSVRSLLHLQENASSARTLNLMAIWSKHGQSPDYSLSPLFTVSLLNRSIIVKHRLRQNELDTFSEKRISGTKVILPIDMTDLRSGARSFLIGQKGYGDVLTELLGTTDHAGKRDRDLLDAIDSLPSLDPFLMRERLRQAGFHAARCYFDLSDADSARMTEFVQQELAPLVGMTFGDLGLSLNDVTSKLAASIMANASDVEMEPLRVGMGMQVGDFQEGIFCWKGFIYYKWAMSNLLPDVRPVLADLVAARPAGRSTSDERSYIRASKARLVEIMNDACGMVRTTLKVYDDAYLDLTRNGQPRSFREFLLTAPKMFYELGEKLGAIHHVVSFWNFRSASSNMSINASEFVDLLADFELSLGTPRSAVSHQHC
jgi:hypothetical protein